MRLEQRTASSVACLLLAVAVLLALAPDGAALPAPGERARSVHAPRCALSGARTIAANRHVRVFRAGRRFGKVYGCRRTAGRAYELGLQGECQNNDEIDGVVVSGNLAALNVQTCGLDFTQSRVALVSLRSGLVTFASAPLQSSAPAGSYDAIRGMVVTADGRLAWLGVRVARGAVVDAQVRRRARGSGSRAVLLDVGADIDPRSLRRDDVRASWRRGGVARSARL